MFCPRLATVCAFPYIDSIKRRVALDLPVGFVASAFATLAEIKNNHWRCAGVLLKTYFERIMLKAG